MEGEAEHIYVVTEGNPINFRFTNTEHKIDHVLTVSVEAGKLMVHRHHEAIVPDTDPYAGTGNRINGK